jgi:predicted esterase
MREDDRLGASGRWVGLLGFSQGARMAGCLLLRQQQQQEEGEADSPPWLLQSKQQLSPSYRFAVLMAGRGPLAAADSADPVLLRLPTIHVHGTLDAGLAMHRQLLHCCCAEGSGRLVEWCGDHRVPIKTKDVAPVVAAILAVARESGAIITKDWQ